MPQSTTIMDEFSIADLRKEEVVKQFTTWSTFYIPPRDAAPVDEGIMQSLGLSSNDMQYTMYPPSSTMRLGIRSPNLDVYGRAGRAAIEKLDHHTPAARHQVLRASPAIRKFMEDLALKSDLRDRYKADPHTVLDAIPGLTSQEKIALGFGKPGPVYKVMRATGRETADGQEHVPHDLTTTDEPGAPVLLLLLLQTT